MEQQATLPTSRELITSLINTLTTPVPPDPTQAPPANEPYSAPSTALKNLPSSQRKILTTLHVLFQPGVLLQSLDLLDRGLVTRVILKEPESTEAREGVEGEDGGFWPPQAHVHLPTTNVSAAHEKEEVEDGNGGGKKNQMYLVKSAQPQKSRFSHSGGGSGLVYIVRLEAWGCSCAAFAFSAFPSHTTQPNPWGVVGEDEIGIGDWRSEDNGGRRGGGRDGGEQAEWEFGGLSLDCKNGDAGGGGVPVCKHLLACFLAERWDEVLGGFVKERVVGREEMAGLGAES